MNARAFDSDAAVAKRLALEKIVLRGLCSKRIGASARALFASRLAEYPWGGPEHRTFYDAVVRCGLIETGQLRAEMPAMVTRLGFPDMNLEGYFEDKMARGADDEELRSAVENLLNLGESNPE